MTRTVARLTAAIALVTAVVSWPAPNRAAQNPPGQNPPPAQNPPAQDPQSQIQIRPPVFRLAKDAVRLDVLAVDGGKPIAGLTPADFDVRDNGVVQSIDLATMADHVSVAIALDVQAAGTVSRELLEAAETLARALRTGDHAWLVTFSRTFDLRVGPTSDPEAVRTAISHSELAAGKSLWDAVFSSAALVHGLDGRALVVVMSDGREPDLKMEWLDEARALETLRRGEVTISAVQPRSLISSPTALERVARATGGTVIEAAPAEQLTRQFDALLNQYRLSYLLTYTPTGVSHGDGWHKISIQLKNRSGRVTAREGYFSSDR